jgi:predicted PhzF superfamily epimerase YddE/YHI9
VPASPTIAERLQRGHDLSRKQVARAFAPELAATRGAARAELLAALAATSSWSTWEELRAHQGLSIARAEKVVARTLAALLGKDA